MDFSLASEKELDFMFNLRNDPVSVKFSNRGYLNRETIKKDYLLNPKKQSFIIAIEGISVGYIIFELIDSLIYEISIAICLKHRKKGFGKHALKEGTYFALNNLKAKKIIASVFLENTVSMKLFLDNNYKVFDKKTNPWKLIYEKD